MYWDKTSMLNSSQQAHNGKVPDCHGLFRILRFLGFGESGLSVGSVDVERAHIVPAALEVRPAENKPWMKNLNRD